MHDAEEREPLFVFEEPLQLPMISCTWHDFLCPRHTTLTEQAAQLTAGAPPWAISTFCGKNSGSVGSHMGLHAVFSSGTRNVLWYVYTQLMLQLCGSSGPDWLPWHGNTVFTTKHRPQAPALDRMGIPSYNWLNDDVHGTATGDGTIFPNGVTLGMSWDTGL